MKINSIKDPLVVEARSLQTADHRLKSNKILLYDLEQLQWAVEHQLIVERVFIKEGTKDSLPESISSLPIIETSDGILKRISGTKYLIPIMAIARIDPTQKSESDFTIVLDNLIDYGNIGSIIRTAKGFSIDQFIFTNTDYDPYQRKIINASRGLVFDSDFIHKKDTTDLITHLKDKGFQIVVTSPHATTLQSQTPLKNKPIALVIGNEHSGISQDLIDNSDFQVQIPMSPKVESLNAAVSAGISIYELRFKHLLIMLKEMIFSNLGRQVNVVAKLIQALFDQEIKAVTPLTGRQVIFMMIMHCDSEMTKEQITSDIKLSDDSLQNFLSPILQAGYITHHEDKFTLNEKGQSFLVDIWPLVERTQEKVLSGIKDDDIALLKKTLEKIEHSCMANMSEDTIEGL